MQSRTALYVVRDVLRGHGDAETGDAETATIPSRHLDYTMTSSATANFRSSSVHSF
jgi:hypothetical protein